MRMTILAIAAIVGMAAAAVTANTPAQAQVGGTVASCPAGFGLVGPQYGEWSNWEPAHCVRYATTAANVPPASGNCPAGSGWVDPHFDKWSNWVSGACAQYARP
ncbi:MAG TPA: hypothetical protein VNF04_05240 [Stellaceae bacterium]|nr:hypothetical protein [Stellaceae bacterium]